MKKSILVLTLATLSFTSLADSAFGPSEDISKFYQPFDVKSIPAHKFQSWPYYKYASMNIADFVAFGVADVEPSRVPAKLTQAEQAFDLNKEFKQGQSFAENLVATQTKGFVVMKDNQVLA